MTSVVGLRRLIPLVLSKPARNVHKHNHLLSCYIISAFHFNSDPKFFTSSSSQTTVEKSESAAKGTNITVVNETHDIENEGIPINHKPNSEEALLFTEEIEIKVPDLGEDKVQVEKWYKKEGDLIKTNDTLCDISTEHFTFGMSSDDECDGIMGKILVEEKSQIVVPGDSICIILHKPESTENMIDD